MRWSRSVQTPAAVAALALLAATACSPASGSSLDVRPAAPGVIAAVGAESQYADVIAQVGGRYVSVTAIMTNPGADPHSFEVSSSVAEAVSGARLVVQNGLGYDSFMGRIEAASPDDGRRVVDVGRLVHRGAGTVNPHLWYDPATMPAVARAVGADLARLQPSHAGYFRRRVTGFLGSLRPWLDSLARFASDHPRIPVATTEPVGDYLLDAAGVDDRTPIGLQLDVMNGVDPAPQAVALEDVLLRTRAVRALVYNAQVTDPLTASFVAVAERAHVPVVAVYETMPTPGYRYQSWMRAEIDALTRAVTTGRSTPHL